MTKSRKQCLASVIGLMLAMPAAAQEKAPAPKAAPAGGIQIVLAEGDAAARPIRKGCTSFVHTGGGDIQIAQPAPHVLTVTMTGSALAKGQVLKESAAGWHFDLVQQFAVQAPPGAKLKLTMEGRLIGLLRSGPCNCPKSVATAEVSNASASITCGDATIVSLEMPAKSASCGDNQFIHVREGPLCQPIVPACFTLHQTLELGSVIRKCPAMCKAVAAEFAPSNSLDPAWVGVFDPFHGTINRDFGFRVTIRVVPE